MVREIVRLSLGEDAFAVGTVHRPDASAGLGLLLLNAGQVPREGHGRLSVELGDTLAAEGFTVLRVDLPGLGDSPGALPTRCDTLWRHVEEGGQVGHTLATLEAAQARFGVERWVVGGLCGAAVNALYAAAQRPDTVAGLVLLEPELFLVACAGAGEQEPGPPRRNLRWALDKVRSTDGWLRLVTGDSALGPRLQVVKTVLLPFLMNRAPLPDDLNRPLSMALAKTVQDRVPTLCITARGQLRELYVDKALRAFAPGPRPALTHVRLDDTNHVFTSGGAKRQVAEHLGGWLKALRSGTRSAAA